VRKLGRRRLGAKRPGRWSRLRLLSRGADRGASAVELVILELVILAPALIFVSMLIVQFALWLDATHAALAAAQEGDRAARAAEFNQGNWRQTATQVAMNYYRGLDTSVIAGVSVSRIAFDQGTDTVSVTVSGKLSGIFPLTISETVSGPVECLRSSQSGGAQCARG